MQALCLLRKRGIQIPSRPIHSVKIPLHLDGLTVDQSLRRNSTWHWPLATGPLPEAMCTSGDLSSSVAEPRVAPLLTAFCAAAAAWMPKMKWTWFFIRFKAGKVAMRLVVRFINIIHIHIYSIFCKVEHH